MNRRCNPVYVRDRIRLYKKVLSTTPSSRKDSQEILIFGGGEKSYVQLIGSKSITSLKSLVTKALSTIPGCLIFISVTSMLLLLQG